MDAKTILVTGGSRGIGEELVRGFAAQGHRVVLNYSRSGDEAEAVASALKDEPGDIMCCQANVAQRDSVRQMFAAVADRWGMVDVLINNAGINLDGPFLTMTDDQWQQVQDVVLTGTFICSQEYAKRFQGTRGQIINMGAATALHGRKNGANYCSAKAGVISLTKCLAQELAPTIAVNCVIPGFMETEEVMERFQLHDPVKREQMEARIPQGRLGTVRDIFRMTSFLVNEATYVTGQNLFVNGGQYMG